MINCFHFSIVESLLAPDYSAFAIDFLDFKLVDFVVAPWPQREKPKVVLAEYSAIMRACCPSNYFAASSDFAPTNFDSKRLPFFIITEVLAGTGVYMP